VSRGGESRRIYRLQSPDEAAQQEEDDCADSGDADGTEVKLAGGDLSPPEESRAQPATDEGADDAEQDGDYATGRVPPWYQKLRQCPGDESEKNPVKPERQTQSLREAGVVLRNPRSAATPGRHPIDPQEDERTDDRENYALD
jgi:hypothetical protein